MSWLRLIIDTHADQSEPVADYLQRFGASAISFSAASDEKIFAEPGQESTRLWQATTVSALFPADVDLDILLVCLRNEIDQQNILSLNIEAVADQDWQETFQQTVNVQRFGKLCICPSWEQPPQDVADPIILDPGLAFGTGTHPTTHLCLQWLGKQDLTTKSVIDYGCGSGVLAMAAKRCNASKVSALDIDPQAILAAKKNFEINKLQHSIKLTSEPSDLQPADVLLANILLNPLLELAESFANLVVSKGQITLSGILVTQIDECIQTYQKWFNVSAPVIEQEWAMLTGVRK